MTSRAPGTIALLLAVSAMFAACGASHDGQSSGEGGPGDKALAVFARAAAAETHARAAAIETRFGARVRGDGVRFEALADRGAVRAIVPALDRTAKASVTLPFNAQGAVTLADDGAHVTIAFRLASATPTLLSIDDGVARYAGAVSNGDALGARTRADLFHRVSAAGTEDYVVYDEAPAREELVYDVDVSGAAGLRFVSDTIEFVDAGGVPRLRVAKPYVIDAAKNVYDASLAIEGCRYDRSPAAPQGRAVVAPGASHCTVRVTWRGANVVYPALVDPSWSYTHPMLRARTFHASALLPNGQVLLYGGVNESRIQQNLSVADLYDPATDVFSDGGTIPVIAQFPTATTLASGKVLIVAGDNTADPHTGFLYDAATGIYSPTGPMDHGRVRHSATLLPSGQVFIAGGHDLFTVNPITTGQIFDPAGNGGLGTFRSVAMNTREYPQSTLLGDGRVLITGGEDFSQSPLATADLFDPNAANGLGAVIATGAMSLPRTSHTASSLPGIKALVAGGLSSDLSTPLDSVEIFDPTANAGAGAFSVSGVKLLAPRTSHSATTLPSGELLFVSGTTTARAPLASTEIFDPKSNGGVGRIVAGPPLQSARPGHAATVLAMGDVLATGGQTGAPADSINTAERMKLFVAGAPCTDETECLSGSCDNKVCCATPCNGTCERCVPITGACVKVTSADDEDTCTGASTCSETGECKGKNAGPCKVAADCASTFCVDGVCCDSACQGQCQACDISLKPGTCGTISGTPHGTRPACASGAVCDGQTFDACTSTGATCAADGHTSVSVSGQQVDCAPYTCTANGTCLTACNSVADCASPYACSFDGACVAQSSTAPSSSSGCNAAPMRSTSRSAPRDAGWLVLGGLGLIAFVRRRMSGRRPA